MAEKPETLTENSRLEIVDIARGIAMISIVLGHIGDPTINRVVYVYHLPIFFLITGYFFKPHPHQKGYVQKKFRQLMVPYFFISLVLMIIAGLTANFYGRHPYNEMIRYLIASLYGAGDVYHWPFFIPSIGAIWFLWASFWSSILMNGLSRYSDNIRLLLLGLIVGISYISSSWLWLPFSLQAGGFALIFVYLGYQMKPLLQLIKEQVSREWVVFTILASIAIFAWEIKNFRGLWLVHNFLGNSLMDIIASLAACYLLMWVAWLIQHKCPILKTGLSFIGNYSLLFLAIHLIELNFFPYDQFLLGFLKLSREQYSLWLVVVIVMKLVITTGLLSLLVPINQLRKLFGYASR